MWERAFQARFTASGEPKTLSGNGLPFRRPNGSIRSLLIYRVRSRVGGASAGWRGMDRYPFQWYAHLSIGMDGVMEWIPMQFIPGHGAVPTPARGKGQNESRGGFTTIPVRAQITRR